MVAWLERGKKTLKIKQNLGLVEPMKMQGKRKWGGEDSGNSGVGL